MRYKWHDITLEQNAIIVFDDIDDEGNGIGKYDIGFTDTLTYVAIHESGDGDTGELEQEISEQTITLLVTNEDYLPVSHTEHYNIDSAKAEIDTLGGN